MKKVMLFYDNSKSTGCDGNDLIEVPDDVTEVELDSMAWDGACDWVSSWFDIVEDDEPGDDEIATEDVDGWWEWYDPDKHNMLIAGGSHVLMEGDAYD
jgi:hypothetical protein